MNFTITINAVNCHSSKPNSPAVESTNTKTPSTIDLNGLAAIVCQPNGKTWCPAIFNENKRKNDQWLEQQVFALDFDNGLTPEEAIETLAKYDIIPNMIYTSFSDKPEFRKFRLIFLLDTKITNADTAKWIIINLMNLFGQKADKACKDLSRMFYGSGATTPLFFNEEPIALDKLMDVLNVVQIANDSDKTRKCLFADSSNSVSEPHSLYTYIESEVCGQKQIGTGAQLANSIFNNGEMTRNFDFDKASATVKIFKDFIEGKWLTHPQLFGIATSMRWVEGGIKLMRDTMNKYNSERKTFYTPNNFAILTFVAKMKYTPTNLSNYTPYEEDCEYSNIIYAVRNVKGAIEKITNETEISIEEATDKLIENMDRILTKREKNKVFIVRVPTGLGKTQILSQLRGVSATIAFPTHQLKDEVKGRFAANGTEVITTPELPAFSLPVAAKIEKLYNLNLNEDISAMIKEMARDVKEDVKISTFFTGNVKKSKYSKEDVELAKEYIAKSIECYNNDKDIVLTTHTKATYIDFNSDLMIFDEDPVQQLLAINTISAVDIKKIITLIPDDEEALKKALISIYSRIVDFKAVTEYSETELVSIFAEKRHIFREIILNPKNNFSQSNFLSFIDSTHNQKDENNNINFITRNDFKGLERKTIIIMSATASETIYKNMGFDCEIIDLGKVKSEGKIIQNTKYSLSKASLITRIDKITHKVGDLPVITFADMKSKFANPVENMHFGNCAGYDELKGKDIAVVGTFNRPLFVYVLIAMALGKKVKLTDIRPAEKKVEYNGYRFSIHTWANADITAIQMDLINADLVQACGRNRTIRENCTTYLYSGFPLRETTSFVK